MSNRIIRHYQSDDIEVQYEIPRCIHAAECVRRLNEVFDNAKRPWIQPQNASADAIAETIHHCPTGALHYTRKDGTPDEPAPEKNTLHIVPNGPHHLRGDIEFVRDGGETMLHETRAALCRCGASKNKPFCDNNHDKVGFADPGAVDLTAEAPGEALAAGGKLTITPLTNGPIQVLGNLEIHTTDGNTLYRTETYLCRCGHSSNKPFCDDTHITIGFVAE
jgi:CDGSH-type Zn-finger protein/uncharacterized Fe-S cluster protein YjdI